MTEMLNKLLIFLTDNWAIVTGFAVTISGLLIFLKNYHHLINLKLQNQKLKKEDEKQQDDSSAKFISYLEDYKIEFTSIATNSMAIDGIKRSYLLELLGIEFKNHPIFGNIDYNSLPIPLQNKYFIFISKLNTSLTIEDVSHTLPQNLNIFDTWSNLTKLYFAAYRLPFRKNHLELLKESSYNNANLKIKELVEEIFNYYAIFCAKKTISNIDLEYFHRTKGHVARNLNEAYYLHTEYINSNNEKLLGEIAINFDSIISIVHKILINYNPNESKIAKATKG